jgi:hypothetical protein
MLDLSTNMAFVETCPQELPYPKRKKEHKKTKDGNHLRNNSRMINMNIVQK